MYINIFNIFTINIFISKIKSTYIHLDMNTILIKELYINKPK